MRRVHLFELEDQAWFPGALRDLLTSTLTLGTLATGRYDGVVAHLARLLEVSGERRIVDLCSGASGPWVQLAPALAERVEGLRVTLTDLYPNAAAMTEVTGQAVQWVDYEPSSVDATCPPPHLRGARTMFSAFHHFPPHVARAILAGAVRDEVPIAVFEHTERTLLNVVRTPLLTPLRIALATPRMPFSWRRVLLTYVLPVVPMVTAWDGTVSHLRTYSPGELRELTADLESPRYHFEIGQDPARRGDRLTWLLGWPTGSPAGGT